ncbi:MAG: zinc ribbon domain-containing protein [Acholeplasmataceae bacterium]|nr:zinc ribbon domain-containing protein [Acholeplasmataceae bacterium]
MQYCQRCGHEIENDQTSCPICGTAIYDEYSARYTMSVPDHDKGHIGWGLLGFFMPPAGLFLFIYWHEKKPNSARAAGTGALFCLILFILVACSLVSRQ